MARDESLVWKEVYDRFDPWQPARDPAWRVERAYSPLAELEALLKVDRHAPKVLLAGTTGCGKSTELLRVASRRAAAEFVVFVDLEQHFSRVLGDEAALRTLSVWEVLLLVAAAVYRAAREELGIAFPERMIKDVEQAWERAAVASQSEGATEFDFGKVATSMVVLASAVATPVAGSAVDGLMRVITEITRGVTRKATLGQTRKKLADQNDEMQGMLAAVNNLLGEVQRQHPRLLVIVDGLDRVQDLERARDLFVHSQVLGALVCPLVAAGPFPLRHDLAYANTKGFAPMVLCNEPVFEREQPRMAGPGAVVFERLFGQRVRDLAAGPIIEPDALRRLVWASGGHARSFARLARQLALTCDSAEVAVAEARHVEAAIDKQRKLWESGLTRAHREVLREVIADPSVAPASTLSYELLEMERLLPYPNRSEWYYPHALLTLEFLR